MSSTTFLDIAARIGALGLSRGEVDSAANRREPFRKRSASFVTLETTPIPGMEAITTKGRDLIEVPEDQNPNAEVLIVCPQSWPFENAIAGVAVREAIVEEDYQRTRQLRR